MYFWMRVQNVGKAGGMKGVFWAHTCVWQPDDVSWLGQPGTPGHHWSFIWTLSRIFLTHYQMKYIHKDSTSKVMLLRGNMCQGEIFGRDPDDLVARVPRASQKSSWVSGCALQTPPPLLLSILLSVRFPATPPLLNGVNWICGTHLGTRWPVFICKYHIIYFTAIDCMYTHITTFAL